jgi:hypothetical protein
MSDLVALAVTVCLGGWFFGFSSLLAVDIGPAISAPPVARSIAALGRRSEGGWPRRIRMAISWVGVLIGEGAAVGIVAQNLGRATSLQILILGAQPAVAIAWVVYLGLYRARASRS